MTIDYGMEFYRQKINDRRQKSRLRRLNSVDRTGNSLLIKGRKCIDFCSNDYLGLSAHPFLKQRSIEYTERYGTSSSASRLVTGTLPVHLQLEEQLKSLYGNDALIFNSGFQANVSILPAIAGRHDIILADKICHNSLLNGCKASRASFIRYRHNDLDHLEDLLKKYSGKKDGAVWVVTESVFSMDGDMAPLSETGKLCKRYGALFYVDDAHATGLYGKIGLGRAACNENVDLLLVTFGKAVGAFGAAAIMSKDLKDYLVNYCSGFIYTTSLPPSVIGSVSASFEILTGMNEERDKIHFNASLLRKMLNESGFNFLKSSSQIVPVVTGSDSNTLAISEKLLEKGFFVSAIRPPTVPEGSGRLRITVTSKHTLEQIKSLIKTLSDV